MASDGGTRSSVDGGKADIRRRLTYLMLFRVGLVTLLLITTLAAEIAAPVEQLASPLVLTLFSLIGVNYALTIAYALWLRRAEHAEPLAAVQIGVDLVVTTALLHLTGGTESGFVFMYLLVIVGASTVLLGRGAIAAAAGSIVLYLGLTILRRSGLLPLLGGQVLEVLRPRELFRVAAVNAVAFAATGALAARLAVELKRAGERIASQDEELRDLAALHEDVIRCLTSGLITLSRDHRVLTLNAAAREILRLVPAHTLGRPIDEVLPDLAPLLSTVGESQQLRRGEVDVRDAHGALRTLGISLSPLVDADGRVRGRIINFQDLTELRRMELAVNRAERLAAIGRLAAGIAHEIRNPLAAISGSIELLAQGSGAGRPSDGSGRTKRDDSADLMAIVLRETERLNGLISDLLDFARPHKPEPQAVDCALLLGEMVRVFQNDRRLGAAQVELTTDEGVWIDGDPGQLRQVVWNLLRNAAEASPTGSPIALSVRARSDASGRRYAELTVRDHGPGIAPEHRARMFEPFFSTKEGGTGLGLATVHRIVVEHHGEIEMEVAEGGGTAATVRLPLRADPPAS